MKISEYFPLRHNAIVWLTAVSVLLSACSLQQNADTTVPDRAPATGITSPLTPSHLSPEEDKTGEMSEAAQLYELLVHAHMILGTTDSDYEAPSAPRILLGELPAHLPFTPPFPPGARVIGSISTPSETTGDIYATVALPLTETWELFQENLAADGWAVLNPLPFRPIPGADVYQHLLCGDELDYETVVRFYAVGSMQTNVQIHIYDVPGGGPCSVVPRPNAPQDE